MLQNCSVSYFSGLNPHFILLDIAFEKFRVLVWYFRYFCCSFPVHDHYLLFYIQQLRNNCRTFNEDYDLPMIWFLVLRPEREIFRGIISISNISVLRVISHCFWRPESY